MSNEYKEWLKEQTFESLANDNLRIKLELKTAKEENEKLKKVADIAIKMKVTWDEFDKVNESETQALAPQEDNGLYIPQETAQNEFFLAECTGGETDSLRQKTFTLEEVKEIIRNFAKPFKSDNRASLLIKLSQKFEKAVG